MGFTEVNLSDFSGGVLQAGFPGEFSTRQWQEIVGLVPERRGVRSQWEMQRIGGLPVAPLAVRYLRTGLSSYLVVLGADGFIYWRTEPSPELNAAATRTVSGWTKLTTGYRVESPGGTGVAVDPSVLHNFLCDMPVPDLTKRYQVGLLVNQQDPNAQALLIHEDENTNGKLVARVYAGDRRWPDYVIRDAYGNDVTTGGVEWGASGYMPPADVGCMWGDVLVLGRTRWYRNLNTAAKYKTAKLKDATNLAYGSAFWTSYVSPKGKAVPDAFHPYLSFNMGVAGSPEVAIGAMVPTNDGLLVFTTRGTDRDGVTLLRGRPYDYEPVLLRGSIGVPLRPASNGDRPGAAVQWPEADGVVFVEHSGQVWFTDGKDADRLDRVGPVPPGYATDEDQVAAARGTVLLSRNRELWALTMLDRTEDGGFAAWSRLVTPAELAGVQAQVKSLDVTPECVYFVQDGGLWRINLFSANRGLIDGATFTARVTSPLLGDDGAPRRVRWVRAAANVHGYGEIVAVTARPGGLFTDAPVSDGLRTVVGRNLIDGNTTVVRAHGASRTASFTLEVSGNVTVDGLTVYVMGRAGDWLPDGNVGP